MSRLCDKCEQWTRNMEAIYCVRCFDELKVKCVDERQRILKIAEGMILPDDDKMGAIIDKYGNRDVTRLSQGAHQRSFYNAALRELIRRIKELQ